MYVVFISRRLRLYIWYGEVVPSYNINKKNINNFFFCSLGDLIFKEIHERSKTLMWEKIWLDS
jgi:hypothetical protein